MIKENIIKLKRRIPSSITIVAVSKGRTMDEIKEAIEAGINDIGENRVQEALAKYYQLPEVRWHMVGHLQTNKVKEALRIFDLIQSVDSLRLADEIDKQASRINKVQDILIQVNTAGENSKFGLKPDDTVEVMSEIAKFKNINIKGLMTIAPIVDNPQKTRPYFRMLRELKDEINTLNIKHTTLNILSMGMTDDFAQAIEEGSNMIRLGRAIFD